MFSAPVGCISSVLDEMLRHQCFQCVWQVVKVRVSLIKVKVKTLIYPHGEYRLGKPVEIIDEGSFYRIDGTHIFDKHKILSTTLCGDKLTIEMKDKTVTLEVLP